MANWLTRAQIDDILKGMTGRDIFAAIPAGESNLEGAEVAASVFEAAAERQGHGTEALDRIKPTDAIYLAQQLGEVFQQDGPKGKRSGPSPASVDSGG